MKNTVKIFLENYKHEFKHFEIEYNDKKFLDSFKTKHEKFYAGLRVRCKPLFIRFANTKKLSLSILLEILNF